MLIDGNFNFRPLLKVHRQRQLAAPRFFGRRLAPSLLALAPSVLTLAPLVLLLALTCTPIPVLAERLETVVVLGERSTRLLRETASLSHVIERDALHSPAIEHASQVLSPTPGVWVSRGSGQEQLVAIRSPVFTGAGACGAFWMAEDGIGLRAMGFCNANELFDSHFEAAQTVEVFKGPHASIVGGNAQYGAVNVRLPTAREVPDLISLNGNSLGYRRAHLSGGRELGGHGVAALLTGIEDDGTRADSDLKQQKLSLRHSWQRSRELSVENGLTWMHLEQETAGYLEGEGSFRDKQLVRQNLFPDAYRDADALRAYSRWRLRRLDSEWTLTPFVRSNRMDFLMHFVPWKPVETNGHDSAGWQLQWRHFLSGGSEIYWSQEYEHTWGDLREYQATPFSPTLPQGEHYDYEVVGRTAAFSVGTFWQATPKLAADVALRWDDTRYSYDNHLSAGSACAPEVLNCRFFRPPSQENHFAKPSLHAGLVYQWRHDLYTFVKLANGFRVPQTAELYRTQSAEVAAIKPEKTTSLETGVRGEWGGWFAQAAIYAMRNRDGIIQDPERRYINQVDTRHMGFEYELEYAATTWSVNLGGQIADHTYSNNPQLDNSNLPLRDRKLDTAPKHMHHLEVHWQLAEGATLGMKATRMGRYYLDPRNEYEYDGHTLFDLNLSTHLTRQFTLRYAVLNVFDRAYAERADVVGAGTYRYFPGLERRLSVALDYAF